MTDFIDVEPRLWLDESHVLVMRAPRERKARSRGRASDARNLISSMLFGLAVHAIVSPWTAAYSDPIVRSDRVTNERAENGLSRKYWEGLAHVLSRAPSVAEYDDAGETAPLL